MTSAPKASVIVAAYNVAQYLPRCVESLLAQTETSIEVILVDDGSTDETPSLVDGYEAVDPRVTAVHRPNGGLSAARNTGLRVATGDLVYFVDGDDWVEPTLVASMGSWSESATATVLMAGAIVDFHDRDDRLLHSERRTVPHYAISRGAPLDREICDDNFVNLLGYAWNKAYPRKWLLESGYQFEEGLDLVEDIDFNASVLAAADRVVLVPEAFVHYVQRSRLTLGSVRDDTFLTKRLRAISSVDSLLETWGVDRATRIDRKASTSGAALWTALRSSIETSRAVDSLRKTVEQPATEKLLVYARARPAAGWRGLWASFTLRFRWYSVALLPVYASRATKRLAAVFGRTSPRLSTGSADR